MSEQPDRWTGRTIDNRYTVESILGQGGMGVVLRARHKFTGAEVALKMLQPDLQLNEDAKARFLAEARTPTTIGHPGIVQVLDAGITPEGELYLAMELLTGRTLRQAMYPSIPPQIARKITLELLEALGAAHARGIIHRDLKPENVFLVGPASTVKLLDFGIAKVLETTRTVAGAVLGTASYMAPEQLTDASTVDARADLWAVGVMLYEMLAATRPFPGTTLAEIVQALATRQPDPIRQHLPTATPPMEALFGRVLSRDRNQRYATAKDLSAAVTAVLPSGAPTPSAFAPLGPPPQPSFTPQPPSFAPGITPYATPFTPSQPFGTPQQPFAAQPTPNWAPQVGSSPTGLGVGPLGASPAFGSSPGSPGALDASPTGPGWSQPAGAVSAQLPAVAKTGVNWLLIGGGGAALVLLIVVGGVVTRKSNKPLQDCADTCSELSGCGISESECQATCVLGGRRASCIDSSAGKCDAFQTCIGTGEP